MEMAVNSAANMTEMLGDVVEGGTFVLECRFHMRVVSYVQSQVHDEHEERPQQVGREAFQGYTKP